MAVKKEYNILVIEDNSGDFVLIEEFLREKIDSPTIIHAINFKKAKQFLLENIGLDIILLDLSLPDKTGEILIQEIVEIAINTPVIVLTGYADFLFGVRSLSLGISDYILKDELTSFSLYKSIIYSSERKKIMSALEESEKKYSELFHLSPIPMWVLKLDSLQFIDVNMAAIKNYGYSLEEFLTMTIRDLMPREEINKLENQMLSLSDNHSLLHGIINHKKKNAEIITVDIQSNLIQYKGNTAKVILANDVTERLNYIKAIEEQNEKLKNIAWMQSHVVRAPVARIMGLIQLIKDIKGDSEEKQKMLDYVLSSVYELDEVIKNISDKTRAVDY